MDSFLSMPLSHARHNKKAFSFLQSSSNAKFYDWEVTTAFYSALHYVKAELFPNQYESPVNGKIKKYNSFESYYRDAKSKDSELNKHQVLLDLVEEYLQEIWDDYKTLKDNCWTARYDDYKIDPDIANLASDCLTTIADLCEPN